jgi:hypothetical protein
MIVGPTGFFGVDDRLKPIVMMSWQYNSVKKVEQWVRAQV